MIYTLSRQGGMDFSPILKDLQQQNIPILDSDALHQRLDQENQEDQGKHGKHGKQTNSAKEHHMLDHFGEHSPRFRDLWGAQKDHYISFLRLSVYNFALQDNAIIYGHGASFILSELPAIMKIKLIAPEDLRVQWVAQEQNISEHEARLFIHKRERERIGFHRFFFEADWNDESCYDLVLNVGAYNVHNILQAALATPFPEERITLRKKHLKDLIRAEELYMKLLFEEKLFIDLLKVEFSEKTITLRGITGDPKTQEKAKICVQAKYPDHEIVTHFEIMRSSYLYFPSI